MPHPITNDELKGNRRGESNARFLGSVESPKIKFYKVIKDGKPSIVEREKFNQISNKIARDKRYKKKSKFNHKNDSLTLTIIKE